MKKAFTPGSGTPLTFEELVEVEDVLDAAVEWQEGRLPTTETVKIGSGYIRFKAITKTPTTDSR